MKKYCQCCGKKIKGNDFVDMSKLNNPLITGYWCRSCFLSTLYDTIDGLSMNINSILSRLDISTDKEYSGERGDGKKGNCTTNL